MLQPDEAGVFRSGVMRVLPDWIDINGHLNLAYYHVLFDRCGDVAAEGMGCGAGYLRARAHTIYTAEAHVRYLREVHEAAPVVASLRVLDHDEKRIHVWYELHHATEGWLAATSENLWLHIDMSGPRVVAFPADLKARIAAVQAAGAGLGWPAQAGRKIGILRG